MSAPYTDKDLDAVEAYTIERCARAAETCYEAGPSTDAFIAACYIAERIRMLKEQK